MPRRPHIPYDPEYDPDPQRELVTSRELTDPSLRSILSDDSRTPEQRAIDARDDLADAAERIEALEQAVREGTAVPDAEVIIAGLRALMLDARLELHDLGEEVDTDPA